jgi:hypothetical protein
MAKKPPVRTFRCLACEEIYRDDDPDLMPLRECSREDCGEIFVDYLDRIRGESPRGRNEGKWRSDRCCAQGSRTWEEDAMTAAIYALTIVGALLCSLWSAAWAVADTILTCTFADGTAGFEADPGKPIKATLNTSEKP